jgi:hypothetical protein
MSNILLFDGIEINWIRLSQIHQAHTFENIKESLRTMQPFGKRNPVYLIKTITKISKLHFSNKLSSRNHIFSAHD